VIAGFSREGYAYGTTFVLHWKAKKNKIKEMNSSDKYKEKHKRQKQRKRQEPRRKYPKKVASFDNIISTPTL